MLGEEILVYGVPTLAFLVAGYTGYRCAKGRNPRILAWLAAGLVAFSGSMFLGLEGSTGWDGLGYVLALIGISAPAGAGGLIGGITGWIKRNAAKPA